MEITADIVYVGVNDHDIDLFEGQYVVPRGMAYNSYLIKDAKTAVMDTVDARFGDAWMENVAAAVLVSSTEVELTPMVEPRMTML